VSDRDTYTFGDDDVASRRLARLAALYDAETRALVARATRRSSEARSIRRTPEVAEHDALADRTQCGLPARPLALALDLGCGPGWSTRLLHEVAGATRTVGIDASDRYLAEARRRHPALEFVMADVAAVLPIAGADLIVSRFLLTHLARPTEALTAWAAGAAPGARLALHETEGLASSHPALTRYYELLAALQTHHGQVLYIGALLDGALAATPWRIIDSRAVVLDKPAAAMAELHVANLRTWRNDPFARDHFDPHELDELDAALDALAAGRDTAPPVENLARQIIAALD
jgi:SAM-dependent methyltransferase